MTCTETPYLHHDKGSVLAHVVYTLAKSLRRHDQKMSVFIEILQNLPSVAGRFVIPAEGGRE